MERNLKQVYVISNFEYRAADGSSVSILKGDIYVLLNKTNDKWWEVIRKDGIKSFYIPANHVIEWNGMNKFKTVPKAQEYNLSKSEKTKLLSPGKENYESSFHRKRSNSLESKIFLRKFTPLCNEIDLSSAKETTGKLEVIRHRKPRLSKDIWSRRKSWALEDSKLSNYICDGHEEYPCHPLTEWRTSQASTTSSKFPNSSKQYLNKSNGTDTSEFNIPSEDVDCDTNIEHIESVKKLRAKYEDCILKELENIKPVLFPKSLPTLYDNSVKEMCCVPTETFHSDPNNTRNGSFYKFKRDLDDTYSEHDISSEELMGSSHETIDTNNSSFQYTDTPQSSESRGSNTSSPMYANYPLSSSVNPPSPSPDQIPRRELFANWLEFQDDNGRKYYYNSASKKKSWKPPRKSTKKVEEDPKKLEDNCCDINNLPIPVGWRKTFDPDTHQICFLPNSNHSKWFASSDHEGRVYFFEENGTRSYWTLPDFVNCGHVSSQENVSTRDSLNRDSLQNRCTKSISLILNQPTRSPTECSKNLEEGKSSTFPRITGSNWSAAEGNIVSLASFPFLGQKIVKHGELNRTKITEHGRRLRKSWSSSYVILTDQFLIFFKDAKSASQMRPGSLANKPDLCVDLHNASIEWVAEKSSRKNVFQVSTMLELQVLLQQDHASVAAEWVAAIHDTISTSSRVHLSSSCRDNRAEKSPLVPKKSVKLSRSKSAKIKALSASTEDLDISQLERQTKIRDRLRKFFNRRPTIESLKQKGIIKDEPVFGCDLAKLCDLEGTTVPLFVKNCIYAIESLEDNMKADGLYRASGNLSQVQKIRLQVDNNNYDILEHEEDVHVLTGCLKLFFREMKQPLIPSHLFGMMLKSAGLSDSQKKVEQLQLLLQQLPPANFDTLRFLLKHLLKVTVFSQHNRMHISNLAIVFGPTLMWPEQESTNLALDMMQQNLVVESLLLHHSLIFR